MSTKIKLTSTDWQDGPAVHRSFERVLEWPALAGGDRVTLVWRQMRGAWQFCGVERTVLAGDPREPRREKQHIAAQKKPITDAATKRALRAATGQARSNARG